MLEVTKAMAEAIDEAISETTVEVVQLPIEDPTDYAQILAHLRAQTGRLIEAHPNAVFSTSTASGTPQMHACWLLLAAAIPATLLHTRPPQYASDEHPLV